MTGEVKIPESLPWSSDSGLPYSQKPRIDSSGRHIAEFGNAEVERQDIWEEEAFYAVHAANHYPALVRALTEAQQSLADAAGRSRDHGHQYSADLETCAVERADAALQAAGMKI